MGVAMSWITALFLIINVLKCHGSPFVVVHSVQILKKVNDTETMLITGTTYGGSDCEPERRIEVTFNKTEKKIISEELSLALNATIQLCLTKNKTLGTNYFNVSFACEPLITLLKYSMVSVKEGDEWMISRSQSCGFPPKTERTDVVTIILAAFLAVAILAIIVLLVHLWRVNQKKKRSEITRPPSSGTLKRFDNPYTDSVIGTNENRNSTVIAVGGNGQSEPTVKYTPVEDPNAHLEGYTDMSGLNIDGPNDVTTRRGQLQAQQSEEEYLNVYVPPPKPGASGRAASSKKTPQPVDDELENIEPARRATLESGDAPTNLETTDSQSQEIIYENY